MPALITTLGSLGAALGIARLMTHGNDVRGVPLTLINVSTGDLPDAELDHLGRRSS